MTPSLERWPTKAKEAPSPNEVRLAPLDTNPVFESLGNKDIDLQKEKDHLMILYRKHGLGFDLKYGEPNWELLEETKIISIKLTYFSTYVFTFKKKKIDSFFPCINFL